MRVFYVYNVNEFVSEFYLNSPYKLYKMLEEAYYTNKYNLCLSSSYYREITTKFNKLFMNDYFYANHKLDLYYNQKNNNHIIKGRGEDTKLIVSSYFIKIKTNLNYPKFFDTLNNYSNDIFICDFNNNDYFWLKRIAKVKNLPVK